MPSSQPQGSIGTPDAELTRISFLGSDADKDVEGGRDATAAARLARIRTRDGGKDGRRPRAWRRVPAAAGDGGGGGDGGDDGYAEDSDESDEDSDEDSRDSTDSDDSEDSEEDEAIVWLRRVAVLLEDQRVARETVEARVHAWVLPEKEKQFTEISHEYIGELDAKR